MKQIIRVKKVEKVKIIKDRGSINKIGQSIICAPNYLVIEVVGSTSGDLDAIAV